MSELNGILGKVLIFDFIPYLCIVGILIFSIFKIRLMLNKDLHFQINERLYYVSVLICITYIINCTHYTFEGGIEITEEDLPNQIFDCTLFIVHQVTLTLVVFAMYKFTNPSHVEDYSKVIEMSDYTISFIGDQSRDKSMFDRKSNFDLRSRTST